MHSSSLERVIENRIEFGRIWNSVVFMKTFFWFVFTLGTRSVAPLAGVLLCAHANDF